MPKSSTTSRFLTILNKGRILLAPGILLDAGCSRFSDLSSSPSPTALPVGLFSGSGSGQFPGSRHLIHPQVLLGPHPQSPQLLPKPKVWPATQSLHVLVAFTLAVRRKKPEKSHYPSPATIDPALPASPIVPGPPPPPARSPPLPAPLNTPEPGHWLLAQRHTYRAVALGYGVRWNKLSRWYTCSWLNTMRGPAYCLRCAGPWTATSGTCPSCLGSCGSN